MSSNEAASRHHLTFENIRQKNEEGEFWFARDLAPLLDYQDWRNFVQVIKKAKTACERSGHKVEDHSVTSPKWSGSALARIARCRIPGCRVTPVI
ncbi:BRO family protein [Caballeronia sp. BR00000012568055]|uniref:BRO family protein n=1 Tax=Caballeronia sp. BR00000012568055 TaxID=2918761 RepID=UPI0023FA0893|nr:BRO family protein [Caballeronia sp. BR00000012568055]